MESCDNIIIFLLNIVDLNNEKSVSKLIKR
jgi:hypothetical protein